MKRLTTIILLCLCIMGTGDFNFLQAQNTLSEQSSISLISCEPGPDVYAKFGHSGIRVIDSLQGFDITFHYGIFDFDTPFFIAKFVKGATDYQVGLTYTNYFVDEYIKRNSTVHEQVLNLTLQQRQDLFNALNENYKPENRIYRYNFIFDNCATRPFHIIKNSINLPITFNDQDSLQTYRDIIEEYVGYNNWLRFGIDIVIGRQADKPIKEIESISFPLYLMRYMSKGTIHQNDTTIPLIKAENIIYQSTGTQQEKTTFLQSPIWITTILLIVTFLLSILEYLKKSYFKWLDIILFTLFGFMGCIIFFLMFISEHPLVGENFNLLWLNPLQLIIAITLFWKKSYKYQFYYNYFNCTCVIIAMLMLAFNVQIMHNAFFPLMTLILIRSINYIIIHKQNN